MCGLAGFIGPPRDDALRGATLGAMLAAIAHRGPDDEGIWIQGPMALGHRRLAIVDLSPAGHQPMLSSSGRMVLAYNGEIYNHAALRAGLRAQGVVFSGTSDTEVLLALVERDGLGAALKQCVGMFALALWHRDRQVLQLARDRFGEKPLYVGESNSVLLFGSELKALLANPAMHRRVDPAGVHDVITQGYVDAGRSIFEGVSQVRPGTIVTFDVRDAVARKTSEESFWSANEIDASLQAPASITMAEGLLQLDARLQSAVQMQMQADVPVGAFLSGGVDSSLVAAMMVACAGRQVRSYTIGFDDPALNEAAHAAAVARHLGTVHTEFFVTERDAKDLVPSLPDFYDEPMADASQIPTVLLARLARRDVTVALSGDGADEMFGGYPKYRQGMRLWNTPARRQRAALAALGSTLALPLQRMIPSTWQAHWPWHRLPAARAIYGATTCAALARQVGILNREASSYMAPGLAASRLHAMGAVTSSPAAIEPCARGYLRTAMSMDVTGYLPGDILTKVDRATMAASLESRAPLLDHRIHEWASGLPAHLLVDDRHGKIILRQLLYRYVPRALVDRPKAGFKAPLESWLRGDLKDWAMATLSSSAAQALIHGPSSVALLERHCRGPYDFSSRLWPLLTLGQWAQRRLAP